MLGDTLTITVNSVAKTLTKINQDSYSSEYLLKEATGEYRLRVRHSKEKAVPGQVQFDRHNVELTRTIYATATVGQIVRQSYIVIRNPADSAVTDVQYETAALTGFLSATNIGKLYGWES